MSICLAGARAAASRINGAKSRGPKTPGGKARASRNALKHGLRAQKFVVAGDEKVAEFAALEAALVDELAPEGTLQGLLAGRIARAAWRLERAERIEAELCDWVRFALFLEPAAPIDLEQDHRAPHPHLSIGLRSAPREALAFASVPR